MAVKRTINTIIIGIKTFFAFLFLVKATVITKQAAIPPIIQNINGKFTIIIISPLMIIASIIAYFAKKVKLFGGK